MMIKFVNMLTMGERKGFKKAYLVHSTNPRVLSDQLKKGLGLRVCGVVHVGDLEAAIKSIQSVRVTEWTKDRRQVLNEKNISPSRLNILQMAQIQSAAGMSEVESVDLQFVGVDAFGASPSLYGHDSF
jgi:hypothetical protein